MLHVSCDVIVMALIVVWYVVIGVDVRVIVVVGDCRDWWLIAD